MPRSGYIRNRTERRRRAAARAALKNYQGNVEDIKQEDGASIDNEEERESVASEETASATEYRNEEEDQSAVPEKEKDQVMSQDEPMSTFCIYGRRTTREHVVFGQGWMGVLMIFGAIATVVVTAIAVVMIAGLKHK